jgi:hypothetical protein
MPAPGSRTKMPARPAAVERIFPHFEAPPNGALWGLPVRKSGFLTPIIVLAGK